MTIKTNLLMITAATFIGTGAFAQGMDPAPTPTEPPSVQFLLDLFGGETAPSKDEVAAAIEGAGYTVNRIRIDEDGEVNIRFTTADGVQYRFRLDEDETRFKQSDDGIDDTSDANGDDTSDTSDSNGDNSDDTSDSNGGSSGGSNSSSGGGSGGGSDD